MSGIPWRSPFRYSRTVLTAAAFAAAATAAPAQDARQLLEDYSTQVTVYGDRLPTHERLLLEAPTPVTVITREEIERSGSRSVQEALRASPGVFLHDQTGNPAEATVDLRGFPQGTSAVVFLDGVRLNNLDDGGVGLDAISLADVERIEVYRGASAPLYGGGALAGVINIITRRGEGIPRADLWAAGGSFSEKSGGVRACGTLGKVDFYSGFSRRLSSGYRENDGYRLNDALARVEFRPSGEQSLAVLFKYADGDLSQPGALTEEEIREDRRQSPYNRFDGTGRRHVLADLSYQWSRGESLRFSAQAFARRHDRDTLTTGRYGMGFRSLYEEAFSGFLAESHGSGARGSCRWTWGAGGEFSRGDVEARGFYTDVEGGHPSPASDTQTRVQPWGAFIQGSARFGNLEASAGIRRDGTRYRFEDLFEPRNDADKTFQRTVARISALFYTSDDSSLFLSYAEGYRIPTVVDLFAYPGFFSNPDLRPARSRDMEAGFRLFRGGGRFQATAFRMRVLDEVVFVLTNPQLFLGQNQNAGSSRRDGLEIEGALPLGGRWDLAGAASYLDAQITGGPYAGRDVPMVPGGSAWAGIAYRAPGGFFQAAVRWVGPQRLDNDLVNGRPLLPGYCTLDLTGGVTRGAFSLEVALQNLLDRSFSSRGITNGYQDYFTPARPISFRLTLTWSF